MQKYQTKLSRQRGFTLLEVMLVMVLMAVVLSSVSLSFDIRSDRNKVEDEAKRLQAVVQLASDYALLNNLQLGLLVDKNSYQFLGYDGELWQEIEDDKVLSKYEMDENFELKLTLGDIPWLDNVDEEAGLFGRNQDEEDDDGKPKLIPQVYLFSSGEITPFSIQFVFNRPFSGEDEIVFEVSGETELPLKVQDLAEVKP
ncbi:type II secretion system minor pseudopilin GspH [Catenovulum sp. 2E275]|uniref:type II secretion system minor pseudopilin GspH n=1 Tax=Catenovulum sp. 2E275 TaxID=2980497 RepID=UPI0021D38A5D|nr:type II secretion system minor pseudopilin GspH [Catenovulum sp. 2E275]MCU4674390.1 type II secretion system minor pseudopilin GspH [Catenovulum sp. 2E275]